MEEHDLSGHSVTYSICGIAASGLFRKMLEPNRMSNLNNRYSYTEYIKNLYIACDISTAVAIKAVDIKLWFDY